MFIRLYKDLIINYDNNLHLVFDNENKFLLWLNQNNYLVEEISSTDAMNYLPNTKEFMVKLSNMNNASLITYIIWYTNNSYKHFRVINYKIYKDYVIYTCESDLWADATYNADFAIHTHVRLTKCNKTFTELDEHNTPIPAYYDSVNFTNDNFTETKFSYQAPPSGFKNGIGVYIALDKAVDSWSVETMVYGNVFSSLLCYVDARITTLSNMAETISGIYEDAQSNKVKIKAIYILPFYPDPLPTPSHPSYISFKYRTRSTEGTLPCYVMANNILTFNYTINTYDYGNNKIYVGAGYSNMELVNIYPQANITYRIILNNYEISAYVEQGDNTKDITSAFILKSTSNDAMLTSQESLARLTSAGFKAVSGALMLSNPATIVGGVASIAGAGIDLINNKKTASYTMEGDAVTTYLNHNWQTSIFSYRVFKAINDLKPYTCLYGLNYNLYKPLSFIFNYGNLLDTSYDPYIKCEVIKSKAMNVEEFDFIKGELERGIYYNIPLVLPPTE